MAHKDFTSPKRKTDPITFTLDGDPHEYSLTPQKLAGPFLEMYEGGSDADVEGAGYDWFLGGLSEEDKARILAKLGNAEDDFDLITLGEVIRWAMEQSAGFPTQPSRASRRQRARTGGS